MDDRRQRTLRRLWAALVLAMSVVAIAVVPSLAGPRAGDQMLLPDLDQAVPDRVAVRASGQGFDLVFDSAVDNVGDGPLLLHGQRQSLDTPEMIATQRVRTEPGSPATIDHPDAGTMRYVQADHNHWHLLGFDTYRLRRADSPGVARPDRKTGFCLGDRYETDTRTELPNEPSSAQIDGQCELDKPNAMTVDEGMSVGYGDNYAGGLEGQQIDISGLPAGRYVLTHEVNADGRLKETSMANNAASVLLELAWPAGPAGAPSVKVLAGCPDSGTCAAPPDGAPAATGPAGAGGTAASTAPATPGLPRMTGEGARFLVYESLTRRLGRRLRGLRRACVRRTALSYSCRVRFSRGPWHYRGRVWVKHAIVRNRVTYLRRIDVVAKRSPCIPRRSCRRQVRVD